MISGNVLSASDKHIASRRALEAVSRLDLVGAIHTSICLRTLGSWYLESTVPEPVPTFGEPFGTTTTGTTLPSATRERLLELSRLEPDWDSYGALAVSVRAVAAAGALMSRIIARTGVQGAPHEIMPIADGGVSLEWRYPNVELIVNACPDGGWTYLLVERDEKGRHFTEGYDLSDDDALALVFQTMDSAHS